MDGDMQIIEVSFRSGGPLESTPRDPAMDSVVAASSKFCLDLFKKISEDNQTGNVFYSPLSISSAMSMVYVGTRGNTAKEMYEVLGFSEEREPEVNDGTPQMAQCAQNPMEVPQTPHKVDDDEINAGFKALMSELNKKDAPYALSLANRLFGEKTFNFDGKYIDTTKEFYGAELVPEDFAGSYEDARKRINYWVEQQTQEKIKDLLEKGNVNSSTKLVLVNAVYFKGNWDGPFDKERTKEKCFNLSKNESKKVDMMHKTDDFPFTYVDEVNCKILGVPYVDRELTMYFILPNEIEDDCTGLLRLEKELTYEKLIEWTRPYRMRPCEVRVTLPKFKMEDTYELEETLSKMGMKDLFSACCDLSGMSSSKGLMLSKVIHKSFVEVNEEGTEAAAATAACVLLGCAGPGARPRIHEFNANHPFLFYIKHNHSDSILFFGRFCSP